MDNERKGSQCFDSGQSTSWVLRNQIKEHNRKAVISLVVAGIIAGVNPIAGLIMLTATGYHVKKRYFFKGKLQQRLNDIQQNISQIISVNKNNF